MFGRHKNQSQDQEGVAVDATLELDLSTVEQAIDVYLNDPSTNLRDELLAALQRLDQQIDLSDDYESRVTGSAAFGYSAKGSVLGETSSASVVDEVPGPELRAQTVLIKAAKREVSTPSPDSLADLRAASQALAAVRSKQPPPQ
jgi:hypothetical protein